MIGEKGLIEKRIGIGVNEIKSMPPHELKRRILTEIERGLNEMREISSIPLESPAMMITIAAVGAQRQSLIITPGMQ